MTTTAVTVGGASCDAYRISGSTSLTLDGADPVNTTLHVPETGLALLDLIPAIGTKFNPAEELGPQPQKARLPGTQTGKVYLRF